MRVIRRPRHARSGAWPSQAWTGSDRRPIAEPRQPKPVKVVPHRVTCNQVGDDAAHAGADAKAVPAHSGRNGQTGDWRVIDDRHRVGQAVDHSGPGRLQPGSDQPGKGPGKAVLHRAQCPNVWRRVQNALALEWADPVQGPAARRRPSVWEALRGGQPKVRRPKILFQYRQIDAKAAKRVLADEEVVPRARGDGIPAVRSPASPRSAPCWRCPPARSPRRS